MTVKLVAGVVPNITAVAPDRPVPTMITELPPVVGPCGGTSVRIIGAIAFLFPSEDEGRVALVDLPWRFIRR
jgi:hypothetical protein